MDAGAVLSRILAFRAPGPVCAAFIRSRAGLKWIEGPVGSGKTTGGLYDFLMCALAMPPSRLDGVRYSKWGVFRPTYRQLWKTTIPSWWELVPREFPTWTGGTEQPASHDLRFDLPDGTVARVLFEFLALGDDWVATLRGWEGTGILFEEGDLNPWECITYPITRLRYPGKRHVDTPSWSGVSATSNALDIGSEAYIKLVEQRRPGWAYFRQPGARSGRGENIANLPDGYYERMLEVLPPDQVARLIDNRYGYSRAGKPVFPEFNPDIHVAAQDLEPDPALPLEIGADAGLTPFAVIGQTNRFGQRRLLDEVPGEGGAERFAADLNRKLAEPRYRPWSTGVMIGGVNMHDDPVPPHRQLRNIQATCDPAADSRAPTDESTWREVMQHWTGLAWRAAPTNQLVPRLEAVRSPLLKTVDGRTPMFQVSPRCRTVIIAFTRGYVYKRLQITGSEQYRDIPDKNDYSHPMDAVQYWALGSGGWEALTGRAERRERVLAELHVDMGEDRL